MRGKRVKALKRQFREANGRPPSKVIVAERRRDVRDLPTMLTNSFMVPEIIADSEWRKLKKESR